MKQITDTIMMIRPANFGFNEETAGNNAFQSNEGDLSKSEISKRALREFDNFVQLLRDNGIYVEVIEDNSKPLKPDAVFPNNWISLHEEGGLITYPMYAPIRRLERREEIIDQLSEKYVVSRRYSFEYYEEENLFLEGTGSMVLDRKNKIIYACLSPRTNIIVLDKFAFLLGYERVVFNSLDRNGQAIYHTNVMMALGENIAVICLDSIANEKEKEEIIESFRKTNKEIISISYEQMGSFAGNMLQVRNNSGQTFLVMSRAAYISLTEDQISAIKRHTNILYSPIPTIEKYGGGSVRCMMAEVFLPKKK